MLFKRRQDYKIWRKENKVRLWDVAQYINLSESTISRWENDMREIQDWQVELYDEFIKNYKKQEE